MDPSKLMLELDPDEHSAYLWLEPQIVTLFGFELFRSYAHAAMDDVVSSLMRDGHWYLWITEFQREFGMPDGTEPDLVLESDYRRVPVDYSWVDAYGLMSLSYGVEFLLTRGAGPLTASDLEGFLSTEDRSRLPQGVEIALLFDPDVESFEAVFSPDLFEAGSEILRAGAHLTSASTRRLKASARFAR